MALIARLDEPTMLAAARFAVMSLVILPLLPAGPFGPAPGIQAARIVDARAVVFGHELRRIYRAARQPIQQATRSQDCSAGWFPRRASR